MVVLSDSVRDVFDLVRKCLSLGSMFDVLMVMFMWCSCGVGFCVRYLMVWSILLRLFIGLFMFMKIMLVVGWCFGVLF